MVQKPLAVGYGATSDPICGCSYDSLFADVEVAINEPWRAIEVDQAGCSIEDCTGYTLRKMKLTAIEEAVAERIAINKEIGLVTYNKCDASGRPGDVERVLAIHTPRRLEFYERSARSGLRVDWTAPYDMALDTFSDIVHLAKKIETSSSDVVGYGLASKPIAGLSQDAAWKAMLFAMRTPAECGLKVDASSRAHRKSPTALSSTMWSLKRSVSLSAHGAPAVRDVLPSFQGRDALGLAISSLHLH